MDRFSSHQFCHFHFFRLKCYSVVPLKQQVTLFNASRLCFVVWLSSVCEWVPLTSTFTELSCLLWHTQLCAILLWSADISACCVYLYRISPSSVLLFSKFCLLHCDDKCCTHLWTFLYFDVFLPTFVKDLEFKKKNQKKMTGVVTLLFGLKRNWLQKADF